MKKLLLLLFVIASLTACTSDGKGNATANYTTAAPKPADDDSTLVIGTVSGGNPPVFVANENTLMSDWQTFLSNNPEIGSCSITQINFVANNGNYYLVATGTQGTNTIKSTLQLSQNNDCLFVAGLKTTCTTTACSSESLGCVPVNTACSECSNKGKCTKTITNAVNIFPSVTPGSCAG